MNLLLLPYLGISTRCAATHEHTDLFPFVSQIRFWCLSHQLHTWSWHSSLLHSQVGTKMDLACISLLLLPLLPPCMPAFCTPVSCLSLQTIICPNRTFHSAACFNFWVIPQKGDDVRVMANAVPHTLFQWPLSCLQFILLFLSFMGTLLSYYTLVFRFTLFSSPCVGTIQFLHKHTYIHCLSSVSGLLWYQHQSLAPFWLSSRLLVLWSTVLSPIPSTMPVTMKYWFLSTMKLSGINPCSICWDKKWCDEEQNPTCNIQLKQKLSSSVVYLSDGMWHFVTWPSTIAYHIACLPTSWLVFQNDNFSPDNNCSVWPYVIKYVSLGIAKLNDIDPLSIC